MKNMIDFSKILFVYLGVSYLNVLVIFVLMEFFFFGVSRMSLKFVILVFMLFFSSMLDGFSFLCMKFWWVKLWSYFTFLVMFKVMVNFFVYFSGCNFLFV